MTLLQPDVQPPPPSRYTHKGLLPVECPASGYSLMGLLLPMPVTNICPAYPTEPLQKDEGRAIYQLTLAALRSLDLGGRVTAVTLTMVYRAEKFRGYLLFFALLHPAR